MTTKNRRFGNVVAACLGAAPALCAGSCATQQDLSRDAQHIAILAAPPTVGCSVLGRIRGVGGGGVASGFIDVPSLEMFARNAALNQAASMGASHVSFEGTQLVPNSAGGYGTAITDGYAYSCGRMPVVATAPPVPAAPPAEGEGAAIRASDSHLWRSWEGTVSQSGSPAYPVKVDLDRAAEFGVCGRVEYPSFGCAATLVDCRASGGVIEATPSLDSQGQCIDGGKTTISLKADQPQKVSWSWRLPDGRVGSQGFLVEASDTHPLLASARRDLPALPPRTDPVLDDELFEVLPQFLVEVMPGGFVTDEPVATSIAAGGRFHVERQYHRTDGSLVLVSMLLERLEHEGATATLNELVARKGEPARFAGFPALWLAGSEAAATTAGGKPGAKTAHIVLTPRLELEVVVTGASTKLVEELVTGLHLEYLSQAEKGGRLALAPLAGNQTYVDPQGHKIQMANGRSAFVDRVVSTEPGDHQGSRNDPNQSLGAPDYHGQGGYYSLGCRGKATFAFDDNYLSDGPGPDLHIFEIGKFVESMSIRISEDGETWIAAGQVKGQPASLDIGPVARAGGQYRFIEVTDLGDECGNESAGADIDAIGAMNGQVTMSPRLVKRTKKGGAGGTRPPSDATPRAIAEAVQHSEGVPLTVTVDGRGWRLLETSSGYTVVSPSFVTGDINNDGRADAIFIATRKHDRQVQHRLEIYTQRGDGLGLLAEAPVGGRSLPAPNGNSVQIDAGNRITFEAGAGPDGHFAFELRNGSLIRLRP